MWLNVIWLTSSIIGQWILPMLLTIWKAHNAVIVGIYRLSAYPDTSWHVVCVAPKIELFSLIHSSHWEETENRFISETTPRYSYHRPSEWVASTLGNGHIHQLIIEALSLVNIQLHFSASMTVTVLQIRYEAEAASERKQAMEIHVISLIIDHAGSSLYCPLRNWKQHSLDTIVVHSIAELLPSIWSSTVSNHW